MIKTMKKTKLNDMTFPNGRQVPLPTKRQTRLVQAEVDLDLFDAVQEEMDLMKQEDNKTKICEVIAWGLKSFLVARNSKHIARITKA